MRSRSVVLLFFFFAGCVQASEVVRLDQFSGDSATVPAPWQVVQLSKKVPPTVYRLAFRDGVHAIEATADHRGQRRHTEREDAGSVSIISGEMIGTGGKSVQSGQ